VKALSSSPSITKKKKEKRKKKKIENGLIRRGYPFKTKLSYLRKTILENFI
jgi:SOS response regulatory protein OraA/RecX